MQSVSCALDSSETLASFMVNGIPDPVRFGAAVGQLLSRAAENAQYMRIYGEMVAELWDEGNVVGAIALEDLWNNLATRYPFSLLCGYPARVFDTAVSAARFWKIFEHHAKMIHLGLGNR